MSGNKEAKPKPSDEELERLVATSLDKGWSGSTVPPWLIRIVSFAAGVAALLVLFLLFRYLV